MAGPSNTPQTKANHEALVRRAAAIAGSLHRPGSVDIRDATETGVPSARKRLVRLARGPAPLLAREGNALELTYRDPVSETALAMLLAAMAGPEDPIAADPESLSVFALAERIAASDIPVLINGPTGTGKEVLSRFIHARSPRREGPFIAVNCAAMPETMLEAMLFGHRKGAFTGATEASEGFMRAADGGTLLLDEIAEMPLALQAKLLRALQEQEVVPIGATQAIKVDVRVIACANRDLPTEVAEGRFRADLYYRLNVFPLALSPLHARPDDIAPLAFAMALRHVAPLAGQRIAVPCFGEPALAMLKLHSWPGNVRELENVVRRALLLALDSETIAPAHIVFDSPARLLAPTTPAPALAQVAEDTAPRRLSSIVQMSEARAIAETLAACGGNRQRTARALGISERTLRYRLAAMREAGIPIDGTAVHGHELANGERAAGGRR
ncbi:sigma 54-interacting transcriptional regulator [Novosphingobium sp. YJ-S2-02]|uniref:Sigma 54-interacting transcriptional regulator n=1 Tax=Novosphingobium aureum TaxID=2792964 RepID=A0A931HAT5_9SPHN|nr:sigma 54-interacting transcriptional regulator [Novosphingobium aureum]MBH0112128.1 sigma 54-interacting transcriptional regulator [Novosphingobium aureum]